MKSLKEQIRTKALSLGFVDLRVAKAERLDVQSKNLKKWLEQEFHGEMQYMENHFEKRVDPRELVPGAKTVISLAFNYFPNEEQKSDSFHIARYAYGKDYHHILKKKLYELYNWIDTEITPIEGRVFVDSAPVMERDWAQISGLGWIGKNTLLIHPKRGSYYFLAEIISDLNLPIDEPISDYCGTCTKCIDACPTDAIDENGYQLDGSKCISYATIEYKEQNLPQDFKDESGNDKLNDWIFGCDICQEVCPWNRFSKGHSEKEFEPHPDLLSYTKEQWAELSREEFNEIFRKSAVKRTKYSGLKRNINWAEKQSDEI